MDNVFDHPNMLIVIVLLGMFGSVVLRVLSIIKKNSSPSTFTIGQPEAEALVIDQELTQPMSERVLALMQRAKHPMTAGMVMRRLYPRLRDRNFFLFRLIKSNLQALVRDGSADSRKSGRGNLVYEVHA